MHADVAKVAPHGFNGIFAMIVNDKNRLPDSTVRPGMRAATRGRETA
jgi:hypothetical protein